MPYYKEREELTREEAHIEEDVISLGHNTCPSFRRVLRVDNEHATPKNDPVSKTQEAQRYDNLELAIPKGDAIIRRFRTCMR